MFEYRKARVGPKTDIWSMGVLAFELIELCRPFLPPPEKVAFYAMPLVVAEKEPPLAMAGVSQQLLTLIMLMLQKEPDMRPSAAEITQLEWLNLGALSEEERGDLLRTQQTTAEGVRFRQEQAQDTNAATDVLAATGVWGSILCDEKTITKTVATLQ